MRRFLTILAILAAIFLLPLWLFSSGDRGPAGPRVALIDIAGVIAADPPGSLAAAGATAAREVVEHLRAAQEDPRVVAVIVRINSGGGSPAAAQEIYQAIRRTSAQGKPVVASLGDTAASAAYYVAAAADRIVANPGTVTGSIGVIMEVYVINDLLERLGISPEVVTSGPYKDIGSPLRPVTPDERALLQQLVADVLDQFVEDVASGRRMDADAVRALADGRIFSGRQALELGLVDELGGLEDAVTIAGELAGLDERPAVVPFRRERSLYERLLSLAETFGSLSTLRSWTQTGAAPGGTLPVPAWGFRLR
ncbi:MAG: signal peptide peptidase SppA [Firmicutes bacterium]|nr:signal peptide peptidase SppA [Bacillota bacterium]